MMLMMSLAGGPEPRPAALRSPDLDWGILIQNAAGGEKEALARLYDQSSRLVYGVALRILGNTADAEEVTLDVYTQVWRNAGDYSPGRGAPSSWLIMLTRSRALDRLRSRQSRQQRETPLEEIHEPHSSQEAADETVYLGQRRARVREAMATLAPEQRQAIEMAFFRGLSHSQLAELLGEPLGTVKTRIRLGMIRLRQALGTGKELQ